MSFPIILLFLFFFVLYTKREALYAPSDFKNDETFKELTSRVNNVDERVNKVDEKVNEVDERTKNDSKALSLVQSILTPQEDEQPIDFRKQKEINETIKGTSEEMRDFIYTRAYEMRSSNWQNKEAKHIIERTIPIFRALITSDPRNDRYHANLAYALIDKRHLSDLKVARKDWIGALSEINEAIKVRDTFGPKENFYNENYEYTRAYCILNLDEDFRNEKPSTSKVKIEIIRDISIAYPKFRETMLTDPSLCKWMGLNNVKFDDF